MSKKVVILGSTGSVGRQALQVAQSLEMEILGISCNKNLEIFSAQIKEVLPKYVAVANKEACEQIKGRLKGTKTELLCGDTGVEVLASLEQADQVINCISGISGLKGTLSALRAGKLLGLANKESLVVAGPLVAEALKRFGGKILPVDSEHCAIHQALRAGNHNEIKKIILTASGGPFFKKSRQQLKHVTAKEALAHPNWQMGAKITIDSATLLNKGFEVIEASWLFSVPIEQIDVLVHPQSVVHSLVEFKDNSMIAQLGQPDMRGVLAYVMAYPERKEAVIDELDLTKNGPLEFFEVDSQAFRGIEIAKFAYFKGGVSPAICNGASEVLVELFLRGEIGFTDIDEILTRCLNNAEIENLLATEENIFKADKIGRELAQREARKFRC